MTQQYAWAHRDRIQPWDVLALACTEESCAFCAFRLDSGRNVYILRNRHPEARRIRAGDSIRIRCERTLTGTNLHGRFVTFFFRIEGMGLKEIVLDGADALALPVLHRAWDGIL